jgi:maltoporin
MRKTKGLALRTLPLALAMCAVLPAYANDDEGQYIGYFRSGAGSANTKGPQNCYFLGNGNGHGYRLGNECDSYGEFGYAHTIATSDNGAKFVGKVMVADFSPNSSWSGNVQIVQAFVQAQGMSWLNGGLAWVGERFYERPDIHTMDLQYINLNGQGGGFDNIDTGGFGKFSYAIFKDHDSAAFGPTASDPNAAATSFTHSPSAWRNDFLLRGIPVNPGGKLDLVFGYITNSSPGANRHDGYNVHAFHMQGVWGGGNTLGFQYGVGPGTGRGDPIQPTTLAAYQANPQAAENGANQGGAAGNNRMGVAGSTLLGSSDTRLRFFDFLVIQPTKEFSSSFDVIYQRDKLSSLYGVASGTVSWTSFGIRPEYAFTQNFKIQGEIGIDHVSYPNANSQNLTKITIAPTIAVGPGFWNRPELRLFVTHANWNTAAIPTIAMNNNAGNTMGMNTSGTSFGIQIETWFNEDWW